MKFLEKYAILIVVITCLLLFAFHLNLIDISIMEARNFLVSRDMLTQDHWLLTTMNNIPRYQKPPLPSWLATPFGALLGVNNVVAYRLPTALMATAAVLACFYLIKYSTGKKYIAVVNALVMATSFYVIGIQKEAPSDIYTHGFMLWSIYYLFKFFNSEVFKYKWIVIAAIMAAGSLLSKGPVSLYALFLPFCIAYGFTYGFKNFGKKWLGIIAFLVITIVVGAWWFVYVKLADPVTFTNIAKEETSNWSSYNVKPFYYYWSFFTQSGLWTIPAFFSLLYPIVKKHVPNPKVYKFSAIWVAAVIVLLSVIPEKKARYLMPVLIPLSITITMYLEVLFKIGKEKLPKILTIPAYVHFYIIATVSTCLPLAAIYFISKHISISWFWFVLTAVLAATIGIVLFIQIGRKNFLKATLLCVAFHATLTACAIPLSTSFITNKGYYKLPANYNAVTYLYGNIPPEILWQLNNTAPSLPTNVTPSTTLPKEQAFDVMVYPGDEQDFKQNYSPYYNITKVTTINLNTGSKDRDRLLSYHFKLSKKNE